MNYIQCQFIICVMLEYYSGIKCQLIISVMLESILASSADFCMYKGYNVGSGYDAMNERILPNEVYKVSIYY